MIELHEGLEIREIPGEPGFFAREDGTIWTLWNGRKEHWRKNWTLGEDFVGVDLINQVEYLMVRRYTSKLRYVHRTILEAFVGPCPEGLECRHFPDNDTHNNNIWNLSWGTSSQNKHDCLTHGTRNGNKDGRAGSHTLSNDEIAEMIDLSASHTNRDIALMFGVSESCVGQAMKRGHSRLKVTREDADELKAMYATGVKAKELAEMFDVSTCYIYAILRGDRLT